MGSRRPVHSGQGAEGSWTSGSAAPRQEEPARPGRRRRLRARPAGRGSGGTRTWLEQPPLGTCVAGAPRGGNIRPLGGGPARSGLSAKPAGGGQWGQWLVSRGPPAPPLPPPSSVSRRTHPAPLPAPAQPQTARGSRGGDRLGGGRCDPREFSPAEGSSAIPGGHHVHPLPPPSRTPLVYPSSREGGGAGEDTAQAASSWARYQRKVCSNPRALSGRVRGVSTTPCQPLR